MQSALFHRHGSAFSEYMCSPPTTTNYGSVPTVMSAEKDSYYQILLLLKILPALRFVVSAAGKVFLQPFNISQKAGGIL